MAQVNPVRRWIISILIVCLIIAALFITAGHKTPMTNDAIVRAYVIKISPQVPGRIEKLYVKNNQMVKEGDPLFQIYQPPYLYALQKAKAELALTKSEVKMLESEISTAKALIKERTADFKKIGRAHV